jgi:protein-L-isoaspartate(D-aspartate) O-methyltransferase
MTIPRTHVRRTRPPAVRLPKGVLRALDDYCAPAFQEPILRAFLKIPREAFVERTLAQRANDDIALPIGFGQSISRPSTVAQVLSYIEPRPGERILEIGAGSGYVTALLSAMGVETFGIEKNPELARRSRQRLDGIGLSGVVIKVGDGMKGWSEIAPFDAMIISAAVSEVLPPLLSQLRRGGRIIAPLSDTEDEDQRLVLIRSGDVDESSRSVFQLEDLGPCQFVLAA